MEEIIILQKNESMAIDGNVVMKKNFPNSTDLAYENDTSRHRRRYRSAHRGRNENTAVLNKENLRLIATDYGHSYKSDAIFHSARPENTSRAQSAHSTRYPLECRSTLQSPFATKSAADLCWRPGTARSSALSSRSRSTSRLSHRSYDKASTILAENDWNRFPERDRKIAELILSRHSSALDLEIQREHFHSIWDEEKKDSELRKAKEEMSRRKTLIRERQMEELHRKMQKTYQHQAELSSLHQKERELLMKAEKWRHLAEQQEQLRMELATMKRQKNLSRKNSQEVTLLKKNAEEAKLRNLLSQMMEQSMVKAAYKRHIRSLQHHWTLHHSNAEEINRHLERKAEVDENFRRQLNHLEAALEVKEKKQREHYEALTERRSATTREHIIEREEKMYQVNVMQEKLNASYKEWQYDLIRYRELVSARAASVTQQHLTARKEDLRKDRVAKMMLHDRRMEEIISEERKKAAALKRAQKLKQRKTEEFLCRKEQEILQSRATACASAQLRSRLHELCGRDSFDNKLNKLKIEARVWRDVI